MVTDQQPLGQIANRRPAPVGKTLDRQQRLMLPRRQAGGLGGRCAKREEPAQPVAEFGQRLVFSLADGSG